MMKLSDREWKAFVLEDLFKVSGTKTTPLNLLKKNNKKNNKQFPYVTTKSTYNGIDNFFSEYTEDGNVITIDSATDGYVFFQLNKFSASDHVEKLTPKFEINKFIGLFILISIKKATKDKYGYGHKFSQTRIKRQKILLPINNNNPDYDFMEQYIKEKYFNLKSQIKEKQKYEITDWRGLDEVEWKFYYLSDLFDFKRGNQNKMSELNSGYLPLISAKNTNNGYKDFVEKNNKDLYPSSIISLNNDGDGGVGIAYYQPFQSMMDTHVTALINKKNIDKYTKLFISRTITKQRDKFSHGYAISTNRLNRQLIQLPTCNNRPDYDFMEQYMKRKENEVLERI